MLLCWRGGVPQPGGGYPSWGVLQLGVPQLEYSRGYPSWGGYLSWGTPPASWMGYPPGPAGWGTPPGQLDGIPPLASWMGYPPRCELTDKLKLLPLSILRMRAVNIRMALPPTRKEPPSGMCWIRHRFLCIY